MQDDPDANKTPEQVRQEAKERVGKKVADMTGRVKGATGKLDPNAARQVAQDVARTTREAATTVADEAGQGFREVAQTARQAGKDVKQQTEEVKSEFKQDETSR